jgi:hypothetical protein
MTYVRESIERKGWRNWLDEHRSPDGWGATEFDILVIAGAPVTLLMRLWQRNRTTIEKYLAVRKKDNASNKTDQHQADI